MPTTIYTYVDSTGATMVDSAGNTLIRTVSDSSGTNPPAASFTASRTSGDYPLAVTFTDTSTNTPTSWLWNFGDGNTSTSQNPSHTYTSAGTFAVQLTATNSVGSNTSTAQSILVTDPAATDTITPSGSITAPTAGATLSGSAVAVTVSATDNVAVASVQLKVDGVNYGSPDTTSPYSFALDTNALSNGTHILTALITDTSGNTFTTASKNVTVNNTTPATSYTIRQSGLNIHIDAGIGGLNDLSGHGRNLSSSGGAGGGAAPSRNAVQVQSSSRSAFSFDSTTAPLRSAGAMTIACGWILAQSNANFSNYDGLLSGLADNGILVGNTNLPSFYNLHYDYFEYRINDRVYPQSNMAAPIGEFKLIFFRFWKPLAVDGIQIGQDRGDTSRRFRGSVAMMATYATNYNCEQDVRTDAESIAAYYGLTLADAFPYQGTKGDAKKLTKIVLSDDQPTPVYRIKRGKRKSLDLHFTIRQRDETDAFETYWDAHYPAQTFLYRDYDYIPPVDTLVRIKNGSTPEIKLSGARPNTFDYSMEVEEATEGGGS